MIKQKCCLKKYMQDSIFSLICSFSILQQDEHPSSPKSLPPVLMFECVIFLSNLKSIPQEQFHLVKENLKVLSFLQKWSHNLKNGKQRRVVEEMPLRSNFFNDLFFFNASTRWTQPSSPSLLFPVWCWNPILPLFPSNPKSIPQEQFHLVKENRKLISFLQKWLNNLKNGKQRSIV